MQYDLLPAHAVTLLRHLRALADERGVMLADIAATADLHPSAVWRSLGSVLDPYEKNPPDSRVGTIAKLARVFDPAPRFMILPFSLGAPALDLPFAANAVRAWARGAKRAKGWTYADAAQRWGIGESAARRHHINRPVDPMLGSLVELVSLYGHTLRVKLPSLEDTSRFHLHK